MSWVCSNRHRTLRLLELYFWLRYTVCKRELQGTTNFKEILSEMDKIGSLGTYSSCYLMVRHLTVSNVSNARDGERGERD